MSLAIDRKGLLAALLRGGRQHPARDAGLGHLGHGAGHLQGVGYDALPALEQDVAKAKELPATLGTEGKTKPSEPRAASRQHHPRWRSRRRARPSASRSSSSTLANFVNFFIDPKAIA
ncbi:MAG: hypothetical protein U0R76_03220 [Candidatus Nanopelagicales bacterium]